MGERTARKPTTHTGDDWMSLSDAAGELSEHRQTVLKRGIKRELDVKVIAGRTFVSRASVEQFKAQKEAADAK